MAKVEDFGDDFVELTKNVYGIWRMVARRKGVAPSRYHATRGCSSQEVIDRVYERYIQAYERNQKNK